MNRTFAVLGVALCAFANSASADVTTWAIDTPWEFHTANTPPQTNLVGTITWDTDISTYYPASWSFTLTHADPIFTPHYPIVIEGQYPNVSDAMGVGFNFSNDILTTVQIRFGSDPAIVDVLTSGSQPSVAFAANEYVQIGAISSQRIINNGQMTLVPAPASAAIMGFGGLLASRRRR